MSRKLKVGDHVTWNSETRHVSGKVTKGHTHRTSRDDPQYEIKSDKTDRVAAHKGSALRKTSR